MKNLIIATAVFAAAFSAGAQTPTPVPTVPTQSLQAVFINGILSPYGQTLSANAGRDGGITIPVAMKLSNGDVRFNLSGLPFEVMVSSPDMPSGTYGYFVDVANGLFRVSAVATGTVILSVQASTNLLGSPSIMQQQWAINFTNIQTTDFNLPLLVVANTQKATAGQVASHTVVIPPGYYPVGDYYLEVYNDKYQSQGSIPLGPMIHPGQPIQLSGHVVLPFDQGGWLYGYYSLRDQRRSGFTVATGNGYTNMKYAGIRNLDARTDNNGNITFDVNTGNLDDKYRAYVVTTDGFAVEVPVTAPQPKLGGGVRFTYYKVGPGQATITSGSYTPVVVEYIRNGVPIIHSLPNGLQMGDFLPPVEFPTRIVNTTNTVVSPQQ